MNSRQVSIRDIAAQLSVTPGTVSRALNDAPGVGEKTRRSILELARQMQYRPQPFRSKRTNTIGLLIGAEQAGVIDNEFLDVVVNMTACRTSQRGLYMHLDYVLRSNCPVELPQMIRANRVDGVLLAGYPPSAFCALLKEKKIPAVVLHDSAARTGLPSVQHNNFKAMKELVDGLIRQGHRDIAMLLTDRQFPTIEHRYQGFRAAMEEHGLMFRPELCVENLADNLIGGQQGVIRLLEIGRRPSALVCANDWMAIGALFELNRCGLRVPADISLAGGGNYRQSAETDPALTTIDTPWRDTVDLALDLLEEMINQRAFPRHVTESVVDATVIWRASCAAVAMTQP